MTDQIDISPEATDKAIERARLWVRGNGLAHLFIRNKSAKDDMNLLAAMLEAMTARIAELEVENAKLCELDVEYGEVETAIIMADPAFDGDSPHESCGARLVASVERMMSENNRMREALNYIGLYAGTSVLSGNGAAQMARDATKGCSAPADGEQS